MCIGALVHLELAVAVHLISVNLVRLCEEAVLRTIDLQADVVVIQAR